MVAETLKVFSEQYGRISIRSNFNDADLDLVMLRKQVARIFDIESVAFESYPPTRYGKVEVRHTEGRHAAELDRLIGIDTDRNQNNSGNTGLVWPNDTFETPFGKVNARFEKLKDLP